MISTSGSQRRGTPPEIGKPIFIDGDLLSARDGVIVRANASLLPALPAGIPVRGVDFGLDAYTPALDPVELVPVELLSTEIVGFEPTPFTDGDVLQPGPAIWLKAGDLVKALEPATRDLGLDALHGDIGDVARCTPPSITFISNVEVGMIDPATGLATFGGVTQRPFAGDVRIQGSMPEVVNCPDLDKYEYRVEGRSGRRVSQLRAARRRSSGQRGLAAHGTSDSAVALSDIAQRRL